MPNHFDDEWNAKDCAQSESSGRGALKHWIILFTFGFLVYFSRFFSPPSVRSRNVWNENTQNYSHRVFASYELITTPVPDRRVFFTLNSSQPFIVNALITARPSVTPQWLSANLRIDSVKSAVNCCKLMAGSLSHFSPDFNGIRLQQQQQQHHKTHTHTTWIFDETIIPL